MNRIFFNIILFCLINIVYTNIQAQSLPVGTLGIEDYYRRKQLLGEVDPSVSFSIRPISPATAFKVGNIYDPDSTLTSDRLLISSGPLKFAGNLGQFQILPLTWQQQYNSDHPYGWNDGAMISARGYQTMTSAGFFLKFGPLSIQLRPEFVFAQNKDFDGFATDRSDLELQNYYQFYNDLDEPEQFGKGSYSRVNWGQSSIRLTFGPISFGLSNENLWWGPGRRNSIMMTNNAEGFKHLTVNTVKPIKTVIGSFEIQVIGGKLENSKISPLSITQNSTGGELFRPYNDDWRYLTGFNINYQPKWIPGLFLGFTRDFMSYQSDLSGFGDYIPFFVAFQKNTEGQEIDQFERDQRISGYARWVFPKAHSEVYFEYGLNDNSFNFRDFTGSPDHGRAYIFGFSKLVPIKSKIDQYIEVNAEINQISQSTDRLVREAGGFYTHGAVRQGYSNLGQVLGAGTGSGGNLQSIQISWVKKLKKIGVSFERYEHNADFYEKYLSDLYGNSRRWVDFALAANGEWNYKNFLFSAKLQGIKSLNYQWRMKDYTPDEYYIPHNDVFNFHGELGMSFRF